MSGRNLTLRAALGTEGFEDEAVEMEVPEADLMEIGRERFQWWNTVLVARKQ